MSKYAIIDLEMCRIMSEENRSEFGFGNELIQIGAVIVDENLEITEKFNTFVHPQFGAIDEFIENLTGIKQSDVDNAPSTEDALNMFTDWLPDDTYIVSWSESDLNQIQREMIGKEIYIPKLEALFDTWIDCQRDFSDRMGTTKSYKLSEALTIADIYYSDGEHNAYIDAVNTAELFIKMEKEPELKLSPYYSGDDDIDTTASSPFAAILAQMKANEDNGNR